MLLEQTWRWFGHTDPVTLSDARQAGATGIVTALHHLKNGDVWTLEDIRRCKAQVAQAGLQWSVVESVPVHEAIKTGSSQRDTFIRNYQESLTNLAAEGIHTVCYNFMPVLDWTRTDAQYVVTDGSKALRFDAVNFAAFELFVLKRAAAKAEYPATMQEAARQRWDALNEEARQAVIQTILSGLPGTVDDLTVEAFGAMMEPYRTITADQLRENYAYFLQKVVPVAQSSGMKLTVHPDDPPFPILGLPRIVSTEADLHWVTQVVDAPANGICFCTGSLGARADNDLPAMVRTFANKIHFVHLRSVQRETDGSFYEANHLEGSTDMFAVMYELIQLQKQRGAAHPIPFRPDHGHQMLDDLQKKTYPGYSAIGRLRGLAELRGLAMGIERMLE